MSPGGPDERSSALVSMLETLLRALGRAARWLCGAWHRGLVWVARGAIDGQPLARGIAAVVVVSVVVFAIAWTAVALGWWGDDVRTAWNNQQIAATNVSFLDRRIAEHEGARPQRPRVVRPMHPTNKDRIAWATFDEREALWRQTLTDMEAARAAERPYVRSMWVPWAPRHDLLPTPAAMFLQLHHVWFRSVYGVPIGLYLVVVIWLGWRRSKRRREASRRRARNKASPDRLLLGVDHSRAQRGHYLTTEERERHLLVSGTTGAGKSEALKLLAMHDIAAGRGLVFLDMKGDRELAHALYQRCVDVGRRDDFLFLTLEPDACHSYNPLASGDVIAKRDRLISSCIWSQEQFYKNAAKAALGRTLAALARRGGVLTLRDLSTAFAEPDALELVAATADPDDAARFAQDLEHFDKFARENSGLRDNLDEFSTAQLRDRMCVAHADIDLREVHRRDRVVYFELNSQMRPGAAGALARLVLEDLKHLSGELARSAQLRKPFSLYIDEAARAVYEGFIGLITQCRSAGIGIVFATQSPLDLDNDEGQVMLAITQNTNAKLIFRQIDHDSAEFCAKLGGTVDTVKRTSQMTDEGLIMGVNPTGLYSDRTVKEFPVHPDEIKRFVTGQAYLMKATGERVVIQVDYHPIQCRVAFPPPPTRARNERDRQWLGRDRPALDLPALVAEAREARRGQGAKRREPAPNTQPADIAVVPPPDDADAAGATRPNEWDEDTDPEG